VNGRWRDAHWWARQALRLYPQSWRERYGAELADTLAAHRVRPRTVFDITSGAVDAHLHPALAQAQPVTAGKRAAAAPLGALGAALIFGLTELAMQQVHEPRLSWARFAGQHRLVQSLTAGSLALAVLAVAATASALTIVIATALRSGTSADRRDARRGLARAAMLGALWVGLALLAGVLAAQRPGAGTRPLRPADVIAQLVWLASTPLAAVWIARHLRGVLHRARAELTWRATRRLLMAGQGAMLVSTAAAVPSLAVIARSNSQLLSAGWCLALITGTVTSLAWLVLAVRRCPPHFNTDGRSLG
jgi:hypothetical protein